jgi:hypothetical protein
MTRSVAFRAFLFFTACAVLFAVTGILSQVPVAEVLFLITGSLCAVMMLYAASVPSPAPVPVRVRRRR